MHFGAKSKIVPYAENLGKWRKVSIFNENE